MQKIPDILSSCSLFLLFLLTFLFRSAIIDTSFIFYYSLMNTFKKFALATAGTTLTIEQTMAAIAVGTPDTKLVGTNSTDLVTNVQNILS